MAECVINMGAYNLFDQLNDGIAGLGLKLFQSTVNAGQNGAIAPNSIGRLLSMLLLGSVEETRQEILDVITNTDDRDRKLSLNKIASVEDARLAIRLCSLDPYKGLIRSNALFVRDGVVIDDRFSANLNICLEANCDSLVFDKNPDLCTKIINGWIVYDTKGRIERIVQNETIGAETSVIGVSALCVDEPLRCSFQKTNQRTTFTTMDGREIATTFIACTANFNCASTPEFEAIEIPYDNKDLSLVLLLPVDDFNDARNSITTESLKRLMSSMSSGERKIKVILPKFKLEAGYSLMDGLRNLGVVRLFDAAKCDLRRVNRQRDLFVSDIVHKVVLRMDQDVAVAPTATEAVGRKTCKTFVMDKPFLFLLWNNDKKIPLCVGQFCEPYVHGS
jgi:serpin B